MLGFIFGAISVGLLSVVVSNLNEEARDLENYINNVNEINKHIKFCRNNRLLAPSEDWVKLQNMKRCYYTMEDLITKFIIRYLNARSFES